MTKPVSPRVSVSLPPPVMDWLRDWAAKRGLSLSSAVVRALEKMMEGRK